MFIRDSCGFVSIKPWFDIQITWSYEIILHYYHSLQFTLLSHVFHLRLYPYNIPMGSVMEEPVARFTDSWACWGSECLGRAFNEIAWTVFFNLVNLFKWYLFRLHSSKLWFNRVSPRNLCFQGSTGEWRMSGIENN